MCVGRSLVVRVFLFCSIGFLTASCWGQIPELNLTTAPPNPGVGHDYIHSFNETVNPIKGSVDVHIDVPTPPGRGLNFPFAFEYNTTGFYQWEPASDGTPGLRASTVPFSSGGWSYALPMLSVILGSASSPDQSMLPGTCYFISNFVFHDLRGGTNPIGLSWNWDNSGGQVCANLQTPGKVTTGGNDVYLATFEDDSPGPWKVSVAGADGTVYYFDVSGSGLSGATGSDLNYQMYFPYLIEDRNGNKITYAPGSGINGSFTDTLGRNVVSWNGFGSGTTSVTVPGYSAPFQETWATIHAWAFPGTINVITSLTLPNGKQYTFTYDSTYGFLNKITYPTGAYIKYDWAINPKSDSMYYLWTPDTGGSQYLYNQYDWPAVSHRYVSYDGSTIALQQDFTYAPTTFYSTGGKWWSNKQTTVVTHDLARNTTSQTVYSYLPNDPDPNVGVTQFVGYSGSSGAEDTIKYQDGSGNTLKTVKKTWYDARLLKSEQVTLANGLTSEIVYTYNSFPCQNCIPQVTEIDDYDYGQGSPGQLIRKKSATYASFPPTPLYPYGQSLFSLPSSVTISGSSGEVAEKDYSYDQWPTLAASAAQHDDQQYPAGSQLRANATSATSKCFIGTPSTPCTDSTSTYKYDQAGQIVSMTDPCGNTGCSDMNGTTGTNHTATFSYADNFTVLSGGQNTSYTPPSTTDGYLSGITDALGHTSQFSYDFNSGQLTAARDQNDINAGRAGMTYVYSDPFARPTLVKYPDSGQTTYSYNDNGPNPSVTTSKLMGGSTNLTTVAIADAMGRPIQAQLTSDPEGADYTDTSYDGLGRVWMNSNPHRGSASSSDGTTTDTYDALGRTTVVTKQDNSVVLTAYDGTSSNSGGTCTTVTDESGRIRKSCSDALGRLVEVDEPGPGANGGTPGTGTITISGAGQSTTYTYTYQCGPYPSNTCTGTTTIWNGGTIYVTINGFTASTGYGGTIATSTIATNLAAALNASGSPVSAVANGSTIAVTAKAAGSTTNYSISTTATWNTQYFSGPAFTASAGTMTGGTDGLGSSPLITLYNYDALNNLLSVQQEGGTTDTSQWRIRTFTYDSLSRLLSANNPESGNVAYSYDANGNVATKTAPAPNQTGPTSVTTTFLYDSLNRVTSKTYSDSTAPASYSYDVPPSWGLNDVQNVVGRLVEASVHSGSINTSTVNSYDAMGRIVRQWQQTPSQYPSGKFLYRSYDLLGDLTSVVNAAGVTISYGYDPAAHLTSVTSSLVDQNHPSALWTANGAQGYYPNGALQKAAFGNGLTEAILIEPRLQPCRIDLNSSGTLQQSCDDTVPAGTVQHYHYVYGAWGSSNNGDLTEWIASGQQTFNRTYSYDSLNRLASMSAPGDGCSGLSFVYDAWGNRTSQANAGGTCFTFSVSANVHNQFVGYQYDSAGNLMNDGRHSYTYDAENRIIQVDAGATATYTYDALGNRIRKDSGGGWLEYYYGAGGVDSEFTANGWNTGYVYRDGKFLAQYDSSTTHFIFSDQLGDTRLVTNLDGSVHDSMDYLPFGEQISGGTATTHKFTGKERDAESGLDNFGARYYGSSFGRFMTPDWAARPTTVPYAVFGDPQSLNLYSYVRNDPVTRADADGHDDCHHVGPIETCSPLEEKAAEKQKQNERTSATQAASRNHAAQNQHHHHHQPNRRPGTKPAREIYNETSGLRPSADKGAGSSQDLHNGRVGLAQIIEVNKSKARVASDVINDNLKDPKAAAAWADSQAAANEAPTAPNGTNGATHFFLNCDCTPKPAWYSQGEIQESFGPFESSNSGGDIPAGQSVDIEIVVSPAPQ